MKKLKELFHQMVTLMQSRAMPSILSAQEHDGKRVSVSEFQKTAEQHRDELKKLEPLDFTMFPSCFIMIHHVSSRFCARITNSDLQELFKLIDFTGAGALSEEEFIDGLLRMSSAPASKRELLEVQHDLHRMWNMLSVGQEQLREQLNDLLKAPAVPLEISSFMEEVRDMREDCRVCSERDQQQTLVELEAIKAQLQEINKAEEWAHSMKEARPVNCRLSSSLLV